MPRPAVPAELPGTAWSSPARWRSPATTRRYRGQDADATGRVALRRSAEDDRREMTAPASDFLASLGAAEGRALAERGSERTFSRGQALMHEGQVPDRVLVVRSGTVKVFTTTNNGREVVLAV